MIALRTARVTVVLAAIGVLIARSGAAWTPPIGIPAPAFGINDVAPAVPNPWTISTAGFYYIDATKAAATDTSNPYGTPARPRLTIPTVLPAGAVVELHGTYDTSHSSPATLNVQGTSSRPVFIRGVSPSSRPIARRDWEIMGTYAVIENIEFAPAPDGSTSGGLVILLPSSHVALRNCDLHGNASGGGLGIVNWQVPWGTVYTGTGVLDSIVIYNNSIHDNGDLAATYDQDVHGISVSDHVTNLWVVDNQIARNSGDGIQINAGTGQDPSTHHLYIGRNVSHDNKQSGFWVKEATDVIFSQNETYGHRPSNSSLGQCMGGQYTHDWVWFLYNHAHDCEYGITQMSDDGVFVRTFMIGNIIENIHRSQASDPSSAWGPSAIMMAGGYERHVINNTIYNVDSGVNIATPVGSIEVGDNVISTVTQPTASHVLLGFSSMAASTSFHHNLLFGDPRLDYASGQMHPTAGQLAMAQSLSSDPLFINAPAGNFHTATASPVANHAEFNAVYATFLQRYGVSIAFDADGNTRPQAATTDMGAYLANGTQTIGVPPTVTANPTDLKLFTGMPAAFTASASGMPAPAVQWQVSTNNGASFANISGAVGNTYSFSATIQDNGKRFRALFTNASGSSMTTVAMLAVALPPASGADFDGDRLGDLTVWRPSSGTWYTVTSSSGYNYNSMLTHQWGVQSNGDVPMMADMDGDGIADLVLWRTSTSTWFWLTSSSGYSPAAAGTKQWGTVGDQPMLADIDGDGKMDLIVWRPSTGTFYWLTSSTGYSLASYGSKQWGMQGDIPKVADIDGDGRADLIVWRPSTGTWYWLTSSTGYAYPSGGSKSWGVSGDIPMVADMDADGKAEFLVWRASTGMWYWTSPTSNSSIGSTGIQWGNQALGDVPLLTDLDGDGKADMIVWRASTGTWFWLKSSAGYSYGTGGSKQWGMASDLPIVR